MLHSQMMNMGTRRPPPRKIIMNVSVNEIQLKKSENAWKPGMKRPEVQADDPEVQNTQVRPNMYTNTGGGVCPTCYLHNKEGNMYKYIFLQWFLSQKPPISGSHFMLDALQTKCLMTD